MINYWWEITLDDVGCTVTIKANSDIIHIQNPFDKRDDAEFYAEAYIKGYKDARGE